MILGPPISQYYGARRIINWSVFVFGNSSEVKNEVQHVYYFGV